MIPHAVGLITTETLRLLALSLTGVAALYTVISGIEYFYVHRSYVQRMLEPLPKEDNGG
jgi:hypothetical protein